MIYLMVAVQFLKINFSYVFRRFCCLYILIEKQNKIYKLQERARSIFGRVLYVVLAHSNF